MRWAVQVVTWASTLIVVRLLRPADYGIVGMATVYVGLIQLVNEFGFGAAIVNQRDLDTARIARVGGFALAGGATLAAASVLLAPQVAWLFGEPEVGGVIAALSAGFVLSAMQVLPRALLARDLDFRRLAGLDGLEALLGSLVTVVLAVNGFSYWALVIGPLTGRAIGTTIANVWRPHPLAWPREARTIAGAVRFGSHMVAARLAWYVYGNADFAVVGRFLGKAALGAYTVGWTMASVPVDRVGAIVASVTFPVFSAVQDVPVDRVGAIVASVTFPVFSAVQDDKPALRRYLRSLTEGLALVTFPAAIGLALVADELVATVAGDQWRSAIMPLRLLALSAALRSVTPLLPQVLVATGATKRNAQVTLFACTAMPLAFLLGSRWGTAGVAIAWVVGHPLLVTPPFLISALRISGMSFAEYLAALWPAAGTTVLMAAAVVLVRMATPDGWAAPVKLGAHAIVGVLAYTMVLYRLHGERVRAFRTLWRQIRQTR
jgi:PST family polysaccharide transporter